MDENEIQQQVQNWFNWEEKFWTNVRKTEDCWIWDGPYSTSKKCGIFTVDGVSQDVRLISYAIHFKEKPEKKIVRLSCGNPYCIAPHHFVLVGRSIVNTANMGGNKSSLSWDQRFWNLVEKTEECWLWKGAVIKTGYGLFQVHPDHWIKTSTVHRIAYQLTRGEIPKKHKVFQSCKNKICVNPDHLYAATRQVRVKPPIPKTQQPLHTITCDNLQYHQKQDFYWDTFFRSIIEEETGCWKWTGIIKNGYPKGPFGSTRKYAYQVIEQKLQPAQTLIVPSCKSVACVNPSHLVALPPHDALLIHSELLFFSKIKKSEGCWLWQARVTPSGYASAQYAGKTWSAHRLSYFLHKGPIPPGLLVRHNCDTPICMNPDHLILGTVQDNNNDRKIRQRTKTARQDKSLISLSDMQYIRRTYIKFLDAVAKKFSAERKTIHTILKSSA